MLRLGSSCIWRRRRAKDGVLYSDGRRHGLRTARTRLGFERVVVVVQAACSPEHGGHKTAGNGGSGGVNEEERPRKDVGGSMCTTGLGRIEVKMVAADEMVQQRGEGWRRAERQAGGFHSRGSTSLDLLEVPSPATPALGRTPDAPTLRFSNPPIPG